jgi:hypothetical protein
MHREWRVENFLRLFVVLGCCAPWSVGTLAANIDGPELDAATGC